MEKMNVSHAVILMGASGDLKEGSSLERTGPYVRGWILRSTSG